jgi:HD superfamily phosphodiesterase
MRDRASGLAAAQPSAARDEAARVLNQTSDRWRHVVAVAERAQSIADADPAEDRHLLVSAARLHDIGYGLVDSGLHSLDGARHLRSLGAADRLCRLVAHHTAAIVEAEARRLAGELTAEFPPEYSPVADALTYADLTVGPQGQRMTVEERLADILQRYPPGHVVHDSILRAWPRLTVTAVRVERRLRSSSCQASTRSPDR